MQESGELCSLYNSNPAKLADVWCLHLCAAVQFVLLLKFGAVLSNICGLLMAVSCWRHRLQCIVIVQSFLRLLKLTRCHGVSVHGLNLHQNIPLIKFNIPKITPSSPLQVDASVEVNTENPRGDWGMFTLAGVIVLGRWHSSIWET